MKNLLAIIFLSSMTFSGDLLAGDYVKHLESASHMFKMSVSTVNNQVLPLYDQAISTEDQYTALLLKQGLEGCVESMTQNVRQLELIFAEIEEIDSNIEVRFSELVYQYNKMIDTLYSMLSTVNEIIEQ